MGNFPSIMDDQRVEIEDLRTQLAAAIADRDVAIAERQMISERLEYIRVYTERLHYIILHDVMTDVMTDDMHDLLDMIFRMSEPIWSIRE